MEIIKIEEQELKKKYPFDMYARYACIRDIINLNRKNAARLKVLDVGGRGNILKNFLQNDDVYYLDPCVDVSDKNHIMGDGCCMPLKNGSFHWVVSADVFEHISAEKRIQFLDENLRVAHDGVILAAPFYAKEVVRAEANVNEINKLLTEGQEHKWLAEHMKNGLPLEKDIEQYLMRRQFEYQKLSNNALVFWEILTGASLIANNSPYEEIKNELDAFNYFYNTQIYPFDSVEPAYRKVYFIKKKKDLKGIEINIKNDLSSDIVNSALRLVTQIICVQKKIINEKDKQLQQKNIDLVNIRNELDRQVQTSKAIEDELAYQLQAEKKKSDEFIKYLHAVQIKSDDIFKLLQSEHELANQLHAEKKKSDKLTRHLHAAQIKSDDIFKQLQAEQARSEALTKKVQAEQIISDNLASQIKLIQSSVSYRVVQKLNRIKPLMAIYHFFRPFFKGLFRLGFKQHRDVQNPLIRSGIEPPIPPEICDGKTRILLVSYYCPNRYHAGGLRILDIYSILRQNFQNIHLELYTIQRPNIDKDYSSLGNIFDRIYFAKGNVLSFAELAELRGASMSYDVVDFQFLEAAKDIDKFRHVAKKILFTPMELLLRNGLIEMNLKTICGSGLREICLARKANLTICVSDADSRTLKMFSRCKNIQALPTGLSPFEFENELSPDYRPVDVKDKKKTVIYLAYFGSLTNLKALDWYIRNVHPIVQKEVPSYVFLIAGNGDLAKFSSYEDEHLRILGPVDKIAPILSQAKVGIAPALSGSGFRGKINQYALCGLPCVASPLAANGLVYKNGKEIFIESDPKRFAKKIISLLLDDELNQRVRAAARDICMKNYTWKSRLADIPKIYGMPL
jgi:glycosyltransferase involved in cell wall biosynthesis